MSSKIGRVRWAFTAACAVAACWFAPRAAVFADADPPGHMPAASAPSSTAAARGKYLADAGNCVSCHTQPGAMPFTGGVRFDTPFGTLYSSNITPDPVTGIGAWTADDLRRAMHEGIGAGGRRLFPAFPYTSFTKVTDADIDAIYDYLQTLKAERYSPPSSSFVFTQRWAMASWNAMFFSAARVSPDATQSAEWNRGDRKSVV